MLFLNEGGRKEGTEEGVRYRTAETKERIESWPHDVVAAAALSPADTVYNQCQRDANRVHCPLGTFYDVGTIVIIAVISWSYVSSGVTFVASDDRVMRIPHGIVTYLDFAEYKLERAQCKFNFLIWENFNLFVGKVVLIAWWSRCCS